MPGSAAGAGPSIPMGEIRVCRGEGVLRTLLGSCLGVALWDRRTRIAALAHVVLPESQGREGPPGKFADTAVPEMLRLMRQLAGPERLSVQAKIAGGARMFASQSTMTIGEWNVQAVEALLQRHQIPVLGRHLGGEQGRRMLLDAATGVVTIEVVGATPAAL